MAGVLRGFGVGVAILIAALWVAPAWLLPVIVARRLEASAIELEFEGVRPALPWGMTASKLVVARGDGNLELANLSARIRASGVRVDARVGAGTLLLKMRGLRLREGLVRAQALPIESFASFLPGAPALRGTVDGVYRRDQRDTLEATVSRGAVSLQGPVLMDIPFAQLVIAAVREGDGAWRVEFANLRGPPLSGNAQGRVDADGGLALRVAITQLEEPARSAFGLAGLPTGPLPIDLELGGTLGQPSLTALGAQAP